MLLTRERIFKLWAPERAPWSAWAKPVLFSQLDALSAEHGTELPSPSVSSWAPKADGRTAIVLDLPGVESVLFGEALALIGFRPVPLFNALPGPRVSEDASEIHPRPLVDMHSISDALLRSSARIEAVLSSLALEAPPAFLLDADRREGRTPRPGDFDNRSLSLPTDFPSAEFLLAHGVFEVLLVTRSSSTLSAAGQPASDLAHTLVRWQIAGIAIRSSVIDEAQTASAPRSIHVTPPNHFKAIWHNVLSLLGLRRNPLGGFRGKLPGPASSG